MKSIKFKITGIRPLLIHNGELADRTNPYVQAIKEITAKGSKNITEADHEKRDRLEWEGALYWSDRDGGVVMPSDNIERMIKQGADKARLGKKAEASTLVSEVLIPVKHRKSGASRDELYKDPAYQLRKGVVIQRNRVMKVRPLIPTGWTMTFTVEFDDEILNKENIVKAVTQAGSLVGLGTWRPKFGRFTTEVVS